MSVGLLLITHGNIGPTLLDTTVTVLGGCCPLITKTLSISTDCDLETQINLARGVIESLDQGEGVLILTDMYGSTPSNISCSQLNENIAIVAGVNLPMLVRIMNYPNLTLPEMVNKAISGGRDGVLKYNP